jgi:hypothetical protein
MSEHDSPGAVGNGLSSPSIPMVPACVLQIISDRYMYMTALDGRLVETVESSSRILHGASNE